MSRIFFLQDKDDCKVIDSFEYKVTALVETSFILAVYTITIIWTIYNVGKSIGI